MIGFSDTGGGTYCAIASLRLMGFIEDDLLSRDNSSSIINAPLLLEWCLQVHFHHPTLKEFSILLRCNA